MSGVRNLVLLAAVVAATTAAAFSPENKAGREELLTLYLMAVAADRCGFAMTARQADALDREAKALVEKMRLGQRENDAVYSEADVAFERQGPAACDRNGSFAKGFRYTLQKLTGP